VPNIDSLRQARGILPEVVVFDGAATPFTPFTMSVIRLGVVIAN
jgi:hypothetical protein